MAELLASHNYLDENGGLHYQVLTYADGDVKYRHQDEDEESGALGWRWGLGECRVVLYRLPQLLARPNQPVIVCESEADADALAALGLVATCCRVPLGKWPAHLGAWLRGRRLAIIFHEKEMGYRWAFTVAGIAMHYGAESVRLVGMDLEPEGTLRGWLAGWKATWDTSEKESLLTVIKSCQPWLADERHTTPTGETPCSSSPIPSAS